jgi:cobalt/nickel transport system permease protein
MLLFVVAVVATPREQIWAFGVHALVFVGVLVFSELPLGHVLKRMGVEIPFLAFAVFLPLLGSDPRVDVLGASLSQEGLWAAWNIVAKATLGVGASVVLVSTTEIPAILRALSELKVPATIVAIAGFMVRYLDVVGGEIARTRIAMEARGYEAKSLGNARALATAGGALFIRSYERGERVHNAMLARGYTGTMPALVSAPIRAVDWAFGLSVPACAWLIAGVGNL